jgi:hypothetical protein
MEEQVLMKSFCELAARALRAALALLTAALVLPAWAQAPVVTLTPKPVAVTIEGAASHETQDRPRRPHCPHRSVAAHPRRLCHRRPR